MDLRVVSALALIALSSSVGANELAPNPSVLPAQAPLQATVQSDLDKIRELGGEWIYVEDRTEGQPPERLGPPMASRFSMRVEEAGDAVILNGHGSGHRDVRVALDGSPTEVVEPSNRGVSYRGSWKDGTFQYDVGFDKEAGEPGIRMIRRSFTPTSEGLIVRVAIDPQDGGDGLESVGLYRHAEDIPLPVPAKAAIADVAWIAGDWVGTRTSGSSIEERWSPPLGGAMLATARTVNAKGKMVAFEYLRIVERDGGLVYAAQPGGAPKTEFVLTEFGPTDAGGQRAVFDNPRHDYPKRIVYELSVDGKLSASTGYMTGGTPRRSEFSREVQDQSNTRQR